MVLVLSYYRSDYGIQAIKETGENNDLAIRKAESRIPRNAKIISKKLSVKSTNRVIEVRVFGGIKEALEEAKFLIAANEVVRNGKMISAESGGIFGIGAKKAVYHVVVGVNAVAEAVYEIPIDLTGCIGTPQMKILIDMIKDWYKHQAEKNPYLFLPDKLCQSCGKPLKNNPYLTPTKVLCENCTNQMLGTANWTSAIRHLNLDFGPGMPQEILDYAENLNRPH